jgi:hypothetical protein
MSQPTYAPPPAPRRSDFLGAIAAIGLAAVFLAGWVLDIQSFAFFLLSMAIDLAMIIFFLVWWLTRRSLSWGQRFLVLLAALVIAIVFGGLTRRTIQNPVILASNALPIVIAVWWGAYMLTRGSAARVRVPALVACLALVWTPFLLLRMTGFHGNLRGDFHWRWTPTGEELYLAQRNPAVATTAPAKPLELRPADWPAFRGPNRDATVHGLKISTDWQTNPPKVLWKQRVGPAWSSMIIVDDHLYTQEQRGQSEAVVCRDATTGNELWSHEETGRFEDDMSGPGPRATPAFDKGRIFNQGTFGALTCLDASTGRVIWTHDIRKDTDAPMPMWGFSASPLVINDRVITYAGGESKKTIAAYSTDEGHLLWTADAGKMSYGSPQLFEGQGSPSVLMFANEGLFCFDPQSGQLRWQLPLEQKVGLPAALQPCLVSPTSIVIGNGAAFGAQRLDLSPGGGAPTPPSRAWVSTRLKPGFSDMVYHDGFIYGFDGIVFCCVDAATGNRRWREGRYGAGQVLLLADQGLLVVSTEDGQAVLLKCTPEKSEELSRLQAVSGKSWNHLALAQNRLYLRSDAELACLQLPSAQ